MSGPVPVGILQQSGLYCGELDCLRYCYGEELRPWRVTSDHCWGGCLPPTGEYIYGALKALGPDIGSGRLVVVVSWRPG